MADITETLLDYCDCDGHGCEPCYAAEVIRRLRAEMQQVRLDHITTLAELQEAAAEIEWLKEALTDAQNETRRER